MVTKINFYYHYPLLYFIVYLNYQKNYANSEVQVLNTLLLYLSNQSISRLTIRSTHTSIFFSLRF